MEVTFYHWLGFNLLILFILGIDLWRFIRHPHAVTIKEALLASVGWIAIALLFNIWIYFSFGLQPALDFFTGYLLEKSLSIDNLFIFLILFAHFKVPETAKYQVLFYGVLGAILMRALLILGGIALIQSFDWIFVIFGLFLVVTGVRLGLNSVSEEEVEEKIIYIWLRRWLPFTHHYLGNAFIVRHKGRWMATPLLAVLILIETTDLIFALDSIPAILGITIEPFIVYTSNIFAILGLRSLFFALEGIMKAFYLLHYALAFILIFIGIKMMGAHFFHIPTWMTLLILIFSIAVAIMASLLYPLSKRSNNKDN
jgi:tellurite resistance protein TerC